MHMPASIVATLFSMFLVFSTVMPASMPARIGDMTGTSTTWSVDSNLDGIQDGTLVMANVTSLVPNFEHASDLRCSLSWKNISTGIEIDLDNVTVEWMNVPLVADHLDDPGKIYSDVFASTTREFIPVNVTFAGGSWTLAHDKVTGLLLGVYQENASNPYRVTRKFYSRVTATGAFFNPAGLSSYMGWVAAGAFAFAIIYTVSITARDKKLRGKRACFRDDCW
jgi:hypothetical protein